MVFWIKKIAAITGVIAFFGLFALTLADYGDLSWEALASSLVRAFTGAMLFWMVGIVIADILLKGIVSDIENDRKGFVEGGLLQQVQILKEKNSPGGSGLPFAKAAAAGGQNAQAGAKPQPKT